MREANSENDRLKILLGSSETVREVPLNGSVVKIQSGPHGDMGSQTEMI